MQPKPLEIVTSSIPSKTTKTRRTTRQWQDLMQAYEDSRLSQQTFCQRHGIALSTFYAWRNKLKAQSGADNDRPTEQSPFIALAPPEVEIQPDKEWDVELAFANGMTIRLRT